MCQNEFDDDADSLMMVMTEMIVMTAVTTVEYLHQHSNYRSSKSRHRGKIPNH